jgi:hypothetical protein
MKVNIDKCKVLTLGRKKVVKNFTYSINIEEKGIIELEHVDKIKDLGVTIDNDSSFCCHVYDKINKAYQMLGIVGRNFKFLNIASFLLIYKSLVRSHLEYAHAVLNPFRKILINDMEKVQKRATKMITGCKHLSYEERLKYLCLPTLKFRRFRGDMIETYKIMSGHYDSRLVPSLNLSKNIGVRGHSLKLRTERAKYDIRKFSFSSRIVKSWNLLTDDIVLAESVKVFKSRFDQFWKN